ncbi:MAG: rhodanese-like domain-containing protein [Emergencia sp.]
MSIFGFLRQPDINAGIQDFLRTTDGVLLDVRTEEEYKAGHIESSLNIPLQRIENTPNRISDKNTPLFVYCQSGSRSSRATSALKRMGYSNVTNIGGIGSYRGKVVR